MKRLSVLTILGMLTVTSFGCQHWRRNDCDTCCEMPVSSCCPESYSGYSLGGSVVQPGCSSCQTPGVIGAPALTTPVPGTYLPGPG